MSTPITIALCERTRQHVNGARSTGRWIVGHSVTMSAKNLCPRCVCQYGVHLYIYCICVSSDRAIMIWQQGKPPERLAPWILYFNWGRIKSFLKKVSCGSWPSSSCGHPHIYGHRLCNSDNLWAKHSSRHSFIELNMSVSRYTLNPNSVRPDPHKSEYDYGN